LDSARTGKWRSQTRTIAAMNPRRDSPARTDSASCVGTESHAHPAEVNKGTKKVNAAIANLKKFAAFLDLMSEFLGLVDEAIDLAKAI
jgi:hypothetical protein